MSPLFIALSILLAYLLGSVNGSLVVGRLKGGVDIRTLGSGNAGGTNALRTQGPAFALAVVVIDVAKGWISAAWLPLLAAWAAASGGVASAGDTMPAAAGSVATTAALPAACAFAAIVGHVYPVFHGFRGGKGAATLIGAVLALSPLATLIVAGVWLVMVMVFGYVGLATIVAAISLPLVIWGFAIEPMLPLLVFGVLVALLVTFTHRSNLARLRAGTEPRARRLWLLGRFRRLDP